MAKLAPSRTLLNYQTLKCLITAKYASVELSPTDIPKHALVSLIGPPVLVSTQATDSSLVCGANHVSRFLARQAKVLLFDSIEVDEWIEWETSNFDDNLPILIHAKDQGIRFPLNLAAPNKPQFYDSDEFNVVFRIIYSKSKNQDSSKNQTLPPEVSAAHQNLTSTISFFESQLQSSKYILKNTLSLADIILGVSLSASLEFFESSQFPKVRTYVDNLFSSENAFQSAVVQLPLFTKDDDNFDGETISNIIQKIFSKALASAFPNAVDFGITEAVVSRCANPKHGDYQCNSPMKVYQLMKGSSSDFPTRPQQVAQAIVNNLPPNHVIDGAHIEIAGAGFINIRIQKSFFCSCLSKLVENGILPPPMPKKKVLVDFSSPNIAKEMHVGHLRSTIIGDTMCRIFEFCGHEVLRVNHVGDWGTQFGMLITFLQEQYPDFNSNPPNISDLTTFYKAAKGRFDEDAEFKKQSQLKVVSLQSGDPECRKIWNLLCEISRKEFAKVYSRLGVQLEEYGESFYNPIIPEVIEKLKATGITTFENGALLIFVEGYDFPLILQKSDKGYGYDTTDMAALWYRLHKINCDWLIYVTDIGQQSHFYMCFAAAKKAGWINNERHRLEHIGFGLVQSESGKKFKTRSGDTVRLVDLLDYAVDCMKLKLEERVSEEKSPLDRADIPEAAKSIGYGAVKYFDLHQHPTTNYVFSYDRMLDTKGNTAVYLLFAYARLRSILRKAQSEFGINVESLKESKAKLVVEHESEVSLAFELLIFPEVVLNVIKELTPNRLCEYLYNLSIRFTDFVTNCRVLGSDSVHSRILICDATGNVMKKCFDLLGINCIERI